MDDKKLDFRILGSFEVRLGGRLVGLGGGKPRALLAILVLHRNEVVSADRLIDDLWGESPPESALRTVQAYVSRLRKALFPNGASPGEEPESAPGANGRVLLTRGRGYLLEVAPGELDLERFRELAERGRDALSAGRPGEAAAVLSEALGIWRGPPLPEFVYEPFAQGAIAQLEELHLAAVEDRQQWRTMVASRSTDRLINRAAEDLASLMRRAARFLELGEASATIDPQLAAFRDRGHQNIRSDMRELAGAVATFNPRLDIERLADSLFAFISNESPYLRLTNECGRSEDEYTRVTRAILTALIRDATD